MSSSTWDSDAILTGASLIIAGKAISGPASAGTLATIAGTEVFTNKTLTSPTINTATTLGEVVTPASGLTAAGNDRASALVLTADTNNITTAAASTGAVLPASTVGRRVRVYNNGASAIKVYGAGSDTIDGTAGATGVTLTNAKRAEYECVAANTWLSWQMGVVSA